MYDDKPFDQTRFYWLSRNLTLVRFLISVRFGLTLINFSVRYQWWFRVDLAGFTPLRLTTPRFLSVQNWSTERRGHYVTATSVIHTNSGKSKQNNLDLNALSLIKYSKCIYQQPFGSETRKEQADLKQETAARELYVAYYKYWFVLVIKQRIPANMLRGVSAKFMRKKPLYRSNEWGRTKVWGRWFDTPPFLLA